MKKSIRKVISENVGLSSCIGIAGGVITLILAVLCMNGTDMIMGVIIAAAITAIGSLAASVLAKNKLNSLVSDSVEKLAGGNAVNGADVIEEIEKVSYAMKGGILDNSAENEYISKLAAGDFSAQLPESLKNTEKGRVLSALAEGMSRKFNAICNSAQQVNAEGAQMSGAFATLTADAEEQAGALQQLTDSVNNIRGTVDTTAENAHKANEIATGAAAEIEAGNVHMKGLLAAMDNISKSTDEITKFVKVIEDIAFQTNILALNSSVEAARAGGAGKGFAVVAGEVKTLATKSQEAAQQTTAVIEECVRNVREGVAKTGETAKSLAAIAEETREVSRLVGVISDSCDEQRSVIGKIDEGVGQIGMAAKRTDSVAQACMTSAQQLASRSDALKAEIESFSFKADTKTAPAVRTAPRKPAPVTEKTASAPAKKVEAKVEKAEEKPVSAPAKRVEQPVRKAAEKPVEAAEKPAAKAPVAAPKPVFTPRSTAKNDSYATAEFVETPDNKY